MCLCAELDRRRRVAVLLAFLPVETADDDRPHILHAVLEPDESTMRPATLARTGGGDVLDRDVVEMTHSRHVLVLGPMGEGDEIVLELAADATDRNIPHMCVAREKPYRRIAVLAAVQILDQDVLDVISRTAPVALIRIERHEIVVRVSAKSADPPVTSKAIDMDAVLIQRLVIAVEDDVGDDEMLDICQHDAKRLGILECHVPKLKAVDARQHHELSELERLLGIKPETRRIRVLPVTGAFLMRVVAVPESPMDGYVTLRLFATQPIGENRTIRPVGKVRTKAGRTDKMRAAADDKCLRDLMVSRRKHHLAPLVQQ